MYTHGACGTKFIPCCPPQPSELAERSRLETATSEKNGVRRSAPGVVSLRSPARDLSWRAALKGGTSANALVDGVFDPAFHLRLDYTEWMPKRRTDACLLVVEAVDRHQLFGKFL